MKKDTRIIKKINDLEQSNNKCIFCSNKKNLIEYNNKQICNKCMQELIKKFMIM